MESIDRYKTMRENKGEPARQVNEARWFDMLEVLPPENWTRRKESESFMVIECQTANLYTWLVRVGTGDSATYWELVAPDTSTHADMLQRVSED